MAKRNAANNAELEKTTGETEAGIFFEHDVTDEFFMGFALNEARLARDAGEVPIGAVIVIDNRIVGSGHNHPIGSTDPTAHAEILAMREAARAIGNYRLTEATLYVTVEPCAMCAGALVNARVKRLVYGATDLRAGGVDTVFQICTNSSLNHRVEVTSGTLAEECRQLMRRFFKQRRNPRAIEGGEGGEGGEGVNGDQPDLISK
jgi:tRNA(adenine34) deaminase